MRRLEILLSAALLLTPLVAHAQCAAQDDDAPISRVARALHESTSSATVVKSRIAAVKASGHLSFDDADSILHAAIKGGLTTAALRPAWTFFGNPPASVTPETKQMSGSQISAADGARANAMEMYWGMPRDIKQPSGTGQTFRDFSKLDSTMYFLSDRPAKAFRFTVHGNAKKAYTLRFKIAATTIEVPIAKGMTPAKTAAAIQEQIAAKAAAIVSGAGNATHWASGDDSYLSGISASRSGTAVWIAPQVDS